MTENTDKRKYCPEKYSPWTEEEYKILRENSGKLSYKQISSLLPGRSEQAVMHKHQRLGLKTEFRPKKYSANDNFWSDINLVSCYYAGWMNTDGSVTQARNLVRLQLQPEDIEILKILKSKAKFTGNIRWDRGYPSIVISCSRKWLDDLEKIWNITDNKKFRISRPNFDLTRDQKLALIAGSIDGDGWIFVKYANSKPEKVNGYGDINLGFISSSKSYVDYLIELLAELDIHKTVKPWFKKASNAWEFKIYGYAAKNLIDQVRALDIPYLKRKWNCIDFFENWGKDHILQGPKTRKLQISV